MFRLSTISIIFVISLFSSLSASSKAENTESSEDSLKTYNKSEVIVYGATKRPEKITESPVAVTVILPEDIQKSARGGQVGTALIGTTGLDILQNGASDFIVNTRGFNSGLNRRLLVLQDGRDVSMPLLGAMEWNSFSLPLDEFARIELVRGPSASLYGANAFNGVLNLTSYAPKEILGTKVSLLAGDYGTLRGDIRHAGMFGNFSYKLTLGHSQSLNYSNRRDSTQFLEYSGLALEKKVLTKDDRKTFSTYGTLRMDYDLDENSKLVAEGGYSRSGNELYVFGLGRTFVKDVEKPYVRLAYNSSNINVTAHYMKRSVGDSMWLMVPNSPLLDNSSDMMIDFQHNFYALKNLHVVWGIAEQYQLIRTSGTSIPNDIDASYTGAYAQLKYEFSKMLKLVGSARGDFSNQHDGQFSPRLALVLSPSETQQFRISAGRSFQRPNYSELYRSTPDAPAFTLLPNGKYGPPVDFKSVEKKIADSIAVLSGKSAPMLNLGLNAMSARALGNSNLEVEKNIGIEAGYKGVFGKSVYVTVDAYYNILNDFITTFLPGVNPAIQKWSPNLPDSLKQYQSLFQNMVYAPLGARDRQRLSVYNGVPTFVVSNANVGRVEQFGFDVELNYFFNNDFVVSGNYSYYHFNVLESGLNQPLYANTSPSKVNLKATYSYEKLFDITAHFAFSQEYDWLAGITLGKVPAYSVVNLNGGVNITEKMKLGFNVTNLLNNHHYEIFGGTYLPRYFTVKASFEI